MPCNANGNYSASEWVESGSLDTTAVEDSNHFEKCVLVTSTDSYGLIL